MIEFSDVSQAYSDKVFGVRNINLSIADGEFVFIVGPNGSGKTTLTKLITREEKLHSGKLTVGEFSLENLPERDVPRLRRTMGIVFQDFKLFENKTVYENIAFAMRAVSAHPALIRKRVPKMIDIVGLTGKEKNFPHELSGGEQQRTAFARAIVNNPRLIIADEPTNNIDPEMRGEIIELLLKMNRLKKTVIVITHDTALVDMYPHRTVVMNNGIIVSDSKGGVN